MAHLISNGTQINTIPSPGPVIGTPGYWTNGVPGIQAATVIDADWLNMLQEEIGAILAAAGIAFDKANNAQLLAAITQILGVNLNPYLLRSVYDPAIASINGTFASVELAAANLAAEVNGLVLGWTNMATYGAAGVYSFTVPATASGSKIVKVTVTGAGGGGGAASTSLPGGGGGAGGTEICYLNLPSGTVVTVTVGSGGIGGLAGNDGNPGGTSSFGPYAAASGGGGGQGGATGTAGAAGGQGFGPGINLIGGDAGDGSPAGLNVYGGDGGAGFWGGGGRAGTAGGEGGYAYGSGGGSGYGEANAGGAGGQCGVVTVEY